MAEEKFLIQPDGDEITVRHGDATRIFTYKGFHRDLDTVQSLIDLIKVRGSSESSVILWNDTQIKVVLDDSVQDREQDTATYRFKASDQYQEWNDILGDQMSQKELVQFLKHRPDSELSPDYRDLLLGAAQSLKFVTETVGEFEYKDDNNIGVMFKTKDGEGQTYIPNLFEIEIPIFKEGRTFDVEIELELKKPTTDNPRLYFVLTCPNLKRYNTDAVDDEVRRMKAALADYIVLAGS